MSDYGIERLGEAFDQEMSLHVECYFAGASQIEPTQFLNMAKF